MRKGAHRRKVGRRRVQARRLRQAIVVMPHRVRLPSPLQQGQAPRHVLVWLSDEGNSVRLCSDSVGSNSCVLSNVLVLLRVLAVGLLLLASPRDPRRRLRLPRAAYPDS